MAFRVRFENGTNIRAEKGSSRSMDLSFRSEEGEGCESESQKFFIVFESPECIDNKCRIREKKVKVKEICKKFKSYIYKFNENVRFIESLKIYIYILI